MARKAESKRDDILRATKELLWERGYEAMSPRDVLDRSGAGQGSLYHHFPGKLELAVAALNDIAVEEMVAVDAIFADEGPALERIRRYLTREREALRGCRLARLANEANIENAAFREPIVRFLGRVAAHLHRGVAEAQADGDLPRSLDPAATAACLLAIVEGGFVLARTHWDPERMTEAITGALALLDAVSTGLPSTGRGSRGHE